MQAEKRLQTAPCPFCCEIGLHFSEGSTYRWRKAECLGCGATCGDFRTDEDCIKAWNRRAFAPKTDDLDQDWAGMDGATVWHLIDRHAENWAQVGAMMDAWLEANRADGEKKMIQGDDDFGSMGA